MCRYFSYQSCFRGMLCLTMMSGGLLARAEYVVPNGVSATSFWNYADLHQTVLINGGGLVDGGGSPYDAADALHNDTGFWHASNGYQNVAWWVATPSVSQTLVFTLPGTYTLDTSYFWQMNQTGLPTRGVNQYDLLVSSDGITYTSVVPGGSTIPMSPADGSAIGAHSQALTSASNARFVKMEFQSAHSGAANEWIGLSEVRFEGTKTSNGPVFTKFTAPSSAGLPMQPSSSDLLEGKIGSSNLTMYGGVDIDQLTNGIGDADNNHRAVTSQNGGVWEVSYDAVQLGLETDETLDINKINVFAFSDDGLGADISRRFVDFDVWYKTEDAGSWQALFLGAATGYTDENNVALASLAREDLFDIITGVRSLRFDFRPVTSYDSTPGDEWHSGIIEVDVLGSVVRPTNIPGDFNQDGDVDGDDFALWQMNFPTASEASLGMGDGDGDGDVDGADFVIWQTNFPTGLSASSVPEPASMILVMLGCIIALARRQFCGEACKIAGRCRGNF
jgi:hypothetical protein